MKHTCAAKSTLILEKDVSQTSVLAQGGSLLLSLFPPPTNPLSAANRCSCHYILGKMLISTKWHIKMWLSEQKFDMFAYKLKFNLLPQLIATLNNYACSPPRLANVNWSAFPEGFCWPWIYNWWNGINGRLQLGSGDLIWLPLSVHICLGLVVEYWPFVGTCALHVQSEIK